MWFLERGCYLLLHMFLLVLRNCFLRGEPVVSALMPLSAIPAKKLEAHASSYVSHPSCCHRVTMQVCRRGGRARKKLFIAAVSWAYVSSCMCTASGIWSHDVQVACILLRRLVAGPILERHYEWRPHQFRTLLYAHSPLSCYALHSGKRRWLWWKRRETDNRRSDNVDASSVEYRWGPLKIFLNKVLFWNGHEKS